MKSNERFFKWPCLKPSESTVYRQVFYQNSWEIVGPLCTFVNEFMQTESLIEKYNETIGVKLGKNVIFPVKKQNGNLPRQYRLKNLNFLDFG